MKKQIPRADEMTTAQLLARVCRLSGHRIRAQMESIGLHRGQGFVLFHLLQDDGIPQCDLARAMRISPASVTAMLQRMERDGWIERVRDREDQRVVRVSVSEKGRALQSDARRIFREMEAEIHSLYTEEEQRTLKHLLLRLHEHYGEGESHACCPYGTDPEARS
jgi:MarR family transcriptional regulator, organic hydroperoxide resistance regulator